MLCKDLLVSNVWIKNACTSWTTKKLAMYKPINLEINCHPSIAWRVLSPSPFCFNQRVLPAFGMRAMFFLCKICTDSFALVAVKWRNAFYWCNLSCGGRWIFSAAPSHATKVVTVKARFPDDSEASIVLTVVGMFCDTSAWMLLQGVHVVLHYSSFNWLSYALGVVFRFQSLTLSFLAWSVGDWISHFPTFFVSDSR